MNSITKTFDTFKRVNLAELDRVKLMNRTDQKFCLHFSKLPAILEAIKNEYLVLEIDNQSLFEYDNIYFDTPDNQMFIAHQNGKSNRYKIRVRKYVQSEINFLEVKFKNNKGRTIKERINRTDFDTDFSDDELEFIEESSIFSGSKLEPKINSYFNRFTLVDSKFTERVTIDLHPGFRNHEKDITLKNLVIVEVKQSKTSKLALISQILKEHKIERQGFSKYCVGRSLLEDNIKKNNFKPLLLKIRKEYTN